MLSAIAEIINLASEAYSDPDFFDRDHSDPTMFPARPKTMSIYPLAWIGKRFSFKKKKNLLLFSKKNKQLYFMKRFDQFYNSEEEGKGFNNKRDDEDDLSGKGDCLGRNCFVSHLFVAFFDKGKYVRFGLVNLQNRKGSQEVDKKKIHIFKSKELSTIYDSPRPSFVMMNISGNILEFNVSDAEYHHFVRFEMNCEDVLKSTVEVEQCKHTLMRYYRDWIVYPTAINSNRYEIITTCHRNYVEEEEVELKTYTLENGRFQNAKSEVNFGKFTVRELEDSFKKSSIRNIFSTTLYNRVEKELQRFMIINYECSRFNSKFEKTYFTSLTQVVDNTIRILDICNNTHEHNLFTGLVLKQTIMLTNSHILLLLEPTEEENTDEITWMVLDIEERMIERVEPQPTCSNKWDAGQVIDSHNCVLRPFETNPDLFQIYFFIETIKDTSSKQVNFGQIYSCFIKAKSVAKKLSVIKAMFDVDIYCQH